MIIKFRLILLMFSLTIFNCYSGRRMPEVKGIRFDSRFIPKDNEREFTEEEEQVMLNAPDSYWVIVPRFVRYYPALRKEYEAITDSLVRDSIDMKIIENIINNNVKKLTSQEEVNQVARMIKEYNTSDLNKIPRYNKYYDAEYQRKKSKILQVQTKILKEVEKGKISTTTREQLFASYYRKREKILDNKRRLKLLQEAIDYPNPKVYKKLRFDIKKNEYIDYTFMDTVPNPYSYVEALRNGNSDKIVYSQTYNDRVMAAKGHDITKYYDEYKSPEFKFSSNLMYDLNDNPLMALTLSDDITRPQYERKYPYTWAFYNNLYNIQNSSRKTQDYVKKELGLQSMGPMSDSDAEYWFKRVQIKPEAVRFFRINNNTYAVDYADVNTGRLLFQVQYCYELPKFSESRMDPQKTTKIVYYKNGETIDNFMKYTLAPVKK